MKNNAITSATELVSPNSISEFSPDVVIERAKRSAVAMGELMQQVFGDSDGQSPRIEPCDYGDFESPEKMLARAGEVADGMRSLFNVHARLQMSREHR